MIYSGEHIWIIGASSGIGRALAIELSQQGATLILSARRKEELDTLKAELGSQHLVYALDVTDGEQVLRTAQAIRASVPKLDRVIFLSATYTPMSLNALDMAIVKHTLDVNIGGALNVIHAMLPILKAQPCAQIALCGSVAGYMGLPNGQPYSATKAAIINLAESLRAECPRTIDVKLISPGFVRTPLTAKNNFTMPMIITPEAAAKAIAKGLRGRAFEIHFPKGFTCLLKMIALLPYMLLIPLLRKL